MDMGKTALSYMPRMTISPTPFLDVSEDKNSAVPLVKGKINTIKYPSKPPSSADGNLKIKINPPITATNSSYLNQKVYSYQYDKVSVFSIQGRRSTMEDKFRVVQQKAPFPLLLFGVFDGHGGSFAVECVESRLIPNVLSALNHNLKGIRASAAGDKVGRGPSLSATDERSALYHRVLTQEIMSLDRSLLQKASSLPDNSGTTCILGVLYHNELVIANVGDCRAIMYDSNGRTLQLTIDHKPQNPSEKERIRMAGGFVTLSGAGIWRLNGILSVSRGLGDLSLKRCNNVITARPDIHVYPLDVRRPQSGGLKSGGDSSATVGRETSPKKSGVRDDLELDPRFVVVASDGLWNVMSNLEVTRFLTYPTDRVAQEPDHGARSLSLKALALGSTDNVTVLIVDFGRGTGSATAPISRDNGRSASSPPPLLENGLHTRSLYDRRRPTELPALGRSRDAAAPIGSRGGGQAEGWRRSGSPGQSIRIPVQFCNRSQTPPAPVNL